MWSDTPVHLYYGQRALWLPKPHVASDLEYTSHMNTNTMTATLTTPATAPLGEWFTNLSADTRADIAEMVNENGYPLTDIQDFVETYGEQAYVDGHYVTWCELTEHCGADNDAIEAYVDEVGIYNIGSFEDAYMGQHGSGAEFAEEYYIGMLGVQIPDGIVVDWEATWAKELEGDFACNGGYVFNTNV